MKLIVVFLMAVLALCSSSTFAFFTDFLAKSPIQPPQIQDPIVKPVVKSVVESVPKPIFSNFTLLKLILRSLGIPVDHLVQGSKKCVEELGPEAVEAVKNLLGALTYFG